MSVPAIDDDRLLEETFRPVLAADLGPEIGILLTHDGEAGTVRKLPAVILTARHLGDDWSLTGSDGRPMSQKELRAECRVDGTKSESVATIEKLASAVRTSILGITADDAVAWEMIENLEQAGADRGFDGLVRLHVLVFTMLTLRSAA